MIWSMHLTLNRQPRPALQNGEGLGIELKYDQKGSQKSPSFVGFYQRNETIVP
jgi:hypothetical protein